MIAKILVSPNLEDRVGKISTILSEEKVTNPHPDLLYYKAETKLGVEQSKEIRDFFSIKPYSAKGRVVILEDASVLTPEAQNALLKTLEEPPEEAILLFCANSTDNFLPTILSRCQVITLQPPRLQTKNVIARSEATKQSFTEDIQKLLESDIGERFEYIEKLKDQKKKEEFLHALTAFFRDVLITKHDAAVQQFVTDLIQAEEWAKSNVNLRGILEYLMLAMPPKK